MDFDHTLMSDEEMLQVVDQWEAEGLLDPSWMQTSDPFAEPSFSSSNTTPSENSSHRNSYPFPTTTTTTSEAGAPATSPPLLPAATITQDDPADADERRKPSRDPAKRKQQNRNAQRAHRDRQKKLIRDLWAEVHALRQQNKQLLGLRVESSELRAANGRLRREIQAMERIWVEAVAHGEAS